MSNRGERNYKIKYNSARYSAGKTGLPRELVFKTLFNDEEDGYNASATEELDVLEDKESTDFPSVVQVSMVRAVEDENDDETVNLILTCPNLTVGTQTTRGNGSKLVLRDDSYSHYRVGVEAG
jgi:hypothetical protein